MNKLQVSRDRVEQALLEEFLESPACPPNTMNFYQLDGYLRALCIGPGLAHASEWLPLVFNDGQPRYRDDTESKKVMDAIMALHCFHADQVLNAQCDLPVAAIYSAQKNERINLEQWARGFLQGYIYWQDAWDEVLMPVSSGNADVSAEYNTVLADKLDAVLHVVSTVADADLAVIQGTVPGALAGIFTRLPEALIDCGCLGRELYQRGLANTNSQKSNVLIEQFTRESAKVERNQPCSCGSGKKFKKCCLH